MKQLDRNWLNSDGGLSSGKFKGIDLKEYRKEQAKKGGQKKSLKEAEEGVSGDASILNPFQQLLKHQQITNPSKRISSALSSAGLSEAAGELSVDPDPGQSFSKDKGKLMQGLKDRLNKHYAQGVQPENFKQQSQ